MSIWVLDEYDGGELDYPSLGFRAVAGDILSATAAPDGRWSLNADQAANETVDRYGPASIDNTYVEPGDGHVLAWSDAANTYIPTDFTAALISYINTLPLFQIDPASNLFASRLASGDEVTADITMGVAADSTLNDASDGLRIWLAQLGDLYPNLCIKYGIWDDDTKTMQTPLATLQAGTTTPPAGGTNVVVDAFTRTDAELVGDAASTGQTWTGTTAKWATTGTAAVTAATGNMVIPTGVTGDMTIHANVSIDTTPGATARTVLLFSNYLASANNVWVQVSVPTNGVVTCQIFKRVANTPTALTSLASLGLTPTAVNTFDMQISLTGTTLAATVNGVTASTTLSSDDLAAMGGSAGFGSVAPIAAPGISVNSFSVDTPVIPGETQTLTVYNGATPGKKIDYATIWHADMYPTAPDVVLMSTGHNDGFSTPATFLLNCDAFVTALKATYPDVLVMAASQNPEFSPVSTVTAHLARQQAVALWCLRNRHGYIPVLEAYRDEDDGGASRVQEDGIHPTTGSSSTSGAYLFGVTLQTHIVNALL